MTNLSMTADGVLLYDILILLLTFICVLYFFENRKLKNELKKKKNTIEENFKINELYLKKRNGRSEYTLCGNIAKFAKKFPNLIKK